MNKKYKYLYFSPAEKLYIKIYGVGPMDNIITLMQKGLTREKALEIVQERINKCTKECREKYNKQKENEQKKLLKECPFI